MAAAHIRSRRHAAMLFDALLPYAPQWAGTGGAVVNGPYALHLARLACVLGRTDDAERLFEAAGRSAIEGGCTPWLARTHLARAQESSDPIAARHHARAAESLAASCGMPSVASAARVVLGLDRLPNGLTEREAEVLRIIASGATNAETAARMFLSVKTVERHLLNAYRKANVRNRAEATAFALRELA
jgi:DNA-binding CsgD family transcriptional regulator